MAFDLDGILEGAAVFYGPNFNQNEHFCALYRQSPAMVHLGTFSVPERVEAFMLNGQWKQHPVVFIHYDFDTLRQTDSGSLVIFLEQGYTTLTYPNDPLAVSLYSEAQERGLTSGHRVVQDFLREEGD